MMNLFKEWEAKRKSTRGGSSSGVTATGKKRKGGEGASHMPTSFPAHVLSYEQPYLKTFMPPDSYIWKVGAQAHGIPRCHHTMGSPGPFQNTQRMGQ